MSKRRQPDNPQAPVVQRVRLRYAKRGPLRFISHRDFARAFERALRRAEVPMAFSQGFSPHPKISYASAAPTGVASEAEYLELGLQREVDPAELVRALDSVLSPGIDVLDGVVAAPGTTLADRIDASLWRIELPGVTHVDATSAVAAFLAAETIEVERLMKQGMRKLDAREPVISMIISQVSEVDPAPCVIIELVVRHVTPSVRPDDVLSGLRVLAGLEPSEPPRAFRLAQGALTETGDIVDPLEADRTTIGGERGVETVSA
ncbi:radical SAM protein [Longispora fulva]|uniref:Radical SAM-linked protein n=1 Tax=Longispora fulva TaxID=619741 RepID=A0A8J7GJV3_9ACTN|nr:TIGR03936 family radical SAM-associated protein [Longispora fulva]MBG6140784.1 radical SAM-linked protein [Longispora fulva]GIG60952.1 radical SAM protein [Longispora fulva]